jgi:hypothetical protein
MTITTNDDDDNDDINKNETTGKTKTMIILNTWKNYSCHLLNVRVVNNVVQTEIHMAEPLLPVHNFLRLRFVFKSWKGINYHILIKF